MKRESNFLLFDVDVGRVFQALNLILDVAHLSGLFLYLFDEILSFGNPLIFLSGVGINRFLVQFNLMIKAFDPHIVDVFIMPQLLELFAL